MTTPKTQEFQDMVTRFWSDWKRTAPERMESYVIHGKDQDGLDPIARYLWNQALCEASLPAIHTFELAVRNAVHWSMCKETGRDDWYETEGLLKRKEQLRLEDAKNYIRERAVERDPKCDPEAFLTPGRVVAELTLGFWCALFSSPYEASIVHPVLGKGMKSIPTEQKRRGRHYVAERMKKARDLRNRVFHHEAIYHLPDVVHEHDMLFTFSDWLYPNFTRLCGRGSRFSAVHKDGPKPFRQHLEKQVEALLEQQSKK